MGFYDAIKAQLAMVQADLSAVIASINALPDPPLSPPPPVSPPPPPPPPVSPPPPPPPPVSPPPPPITGYQPASALPIFGVNSHPTAASPSVTVALMQATGMRMARLDMNNWDAVEGPKGTYNLSQAQSFVAAFRAAGIKINLMLGYNSHLYTTSSAGWGAGITGSANVAGYAAYCAKVAQAFNGPDIVYELGNEWNLTQFWNPTNANAAGIAMAAGVTAIKNLYPNAVVNTCGTADYGASTLWGPFIQQMIAGAGAAFSKIDGVGMHTYLGGDLSGARQPPEWWFQYPTLFPDLKKYSAPATNFYLTEGGFPIERSSNDTTRQAVLNARAFLTAILMGVKSYLHYDLINDATGNASEDSYGMFLHGVFTKKPTAVAIGNLMAIINDATGFKITLAPKTYAGDDNFAIGFTGPSGLHTVVWSSKQGGGTVSLGVPADRTKVSITDLFGTSVAPVYDGAGNLTVAVSDAGGPRLIAGI